MYSSCAHAECIKILCYSALRFLRSDMFTQGLVGGTYSGPLYKSVSFNNSRAYLSFDHIGEGLHSNDKFLKYFEIADQNKKFYEANAVIKNNKVIVWSKKISNPKFVRYGWKSYLEPNFFNKEGLPASSFSTINEH